MLLDVSLTPFGRSFKRRNSCSPIFGKITAQEKLAPEPM
jgi:hypothetical protein